MKSAAAEIGLEDEMGERRDDLFERLVAGAPVFDTSKPEARAQEAAGVVENVIGSLIGSVKREMESTLKGKKAKAPRADGYTKILLADLKARGWELREVEGD